LLLVPPGESTPTASAIIIMLRHIFDRLVTRRASASTATSEATGSPRSARTAPIGSSDSAATTGSVAAVVPDEAWWQVRLDEGLAEWREAAVAIPESPDGLALVDMLTDSSESVIRQLPSAARDALALCGDQSVSFAQLSARLGQDPSLVQALLRTANSAAIGAGRNPVLGVDGALERIGLIAGRSVVLANCVDGLLSRPGGRYDAMVNDIWSHMIRTAPVARAIAPAFQADSEAAFSIALLHDAGKLVVFDQLSALRVKRRRPVVIPRAFLSALLQALHEPLGALAAMRWSMGPQAALAIGNHHRAKVEQSVNPLAEVIYTAEHVDHTTRRGAALDLDGLFSAGGLSASPFKVAGALGAMWREA
jgi:HD-like signal output (HDOD) protein